MAAAAAQYYFRFRICWYRCLQKVKVHEQTKFRRHISIDGWDITTSVFEKTNVLHIGNLLSVSISAICPKSAHYSASGYRILSKSKHPLRKYDVISISQNGGRDGWILLPVSYLLMLLPSEGQSLLANQICRDISNGGWYIFMAIQNGLGRGQFFLNSRMCQYPGMLCYILWIQFPRWGSAGWKTTYGGKKTSPQRLILYFIIIISSTHRFVSSHFCLKIPNAVCGVQS